ncbi:zincin-like metallopeptidase domain-containing protein [Sphingomonas sp. ABOLE]|uniref:zincin-like metallopeptidase domain-containing protein n=1 Tax=Sphingomonas sp. ABOLE TaxID=1985878 RepID=UPI00321AF8DF
MSQCRAARLLRPHQLVSHRAARAGALDRARLDRDQSGAFGSAAYSREELVAEVASAFTCASLAIRPTVRHADYVGSWLAVLREDEKAIFRAASAASKAADFLLSFVSDEEVGQ